MTGLIKRGMNIQNQMLPNDAQNINLARLNFLAPQVGSIIISHENNMKRTLLISLGSRGDMEPINL